MEAFKKGEEEEKEGVIRCHCFTIETREESLKAIADQDENHNHYVSLLAIAGNLGTILLLTTTAVMTSTFNNTTMMLNFSVALMSFMIQLYLYVIKEKDITF